MQNTEASVQHEPIDGLSTGPIEVLRYSRALSPDILDPFESDFHIYSLVPMSSRVLEIGCGTGSVLQLFRQRDDIDAVGIEPNKERAEYARSLGLTVITGFADHETLSAMGKFDVIILADVLEHTVDPAEMLLLLQTSLVPNGKIIVSLPNVAHWTVRFSLLFGKFDYQPFGIMDATHLRWFTVQSLKRLFDASGFEIRQMKYSCGLWMNEYRTGPFKKIPDRIKRRLIPSLVSALPGLFACQLIAEATRTADTQQSALQTLTSAG